MKKTPYIYKCKICNESETCN